MTHPADQGAVRELRRPQFSVFDQKTLELTEQAEGFLISILFFNGAGPALRQLGRARGKPHGWYARAPSSMRKQTGDFAIRAKRVSRSQRQSQASGANYIISCRALPDPVDNLNARAKMTARTTSSTVISSMLRPTPKPRSDTRGHQNPFTSCCMIFER